MDKLLRWSLLAGSVVVIVAALWFVFGPLTRLIAGTDVERLATVQREDTLNSLRGNLATVLSTFSVVAGAVFTARRFSLEREKQVTESFNTAIDHLESASATVRAGGIAALERILRYSPADRNRVLSTVANYLREHASTGSGHQSADITAAIGMLRQPRRRVRGLRELPLDLRGVRLPDTDLRGVQLAGADLTDAELTGADLRAADLRDATLDRATLINADLRGADLTGASRADARLANAKTDG